jgi:hypothetical protein
LPPAGQQPLYRLECRRLAPQNLCSAGPQPPAGHCNEGRCAPGGRTASSCAADDAQPWHASLLGLKGASIGGSACWPGSATHASLYIADWSARLPAPKFAAAVAQCNSAQALSTATSRVFQLSSAGRAQLASQDAAHGQQLQALSMKQSGRPALLAGDAGVFATGQGGSSSAQAADHWLTAAGFLPLDQRCPLFARKFPATAQQEVLLYALGCAGLGLGSWCNRIRI